MGGGLIQCLFTTPHLPPRTLLHPPLTLSPTPSTLFYTQDVRGLRETVEPELEHLDADTYLELKRDWAEAPRPAEEGIRSVISKQVWTHLGV